MAIVQDEHGAGVARGGVGKEIVDRAGQRLALLGGLGSEAEPYPFVAFAALNLSACACFCAMPPLRVALHKPQKLFAA